MNYLLIIIYALITALACTVILAPLAGRNARMELVLCLVLLPLGAFSTYLAIGHADKAGAYAAFEDANSERARKRDRLARIHTLAHEVETADTPAIEKLIKLGTLRQRLNRHEQAIAAFERANAMSEHYATLPRKLGQAYFRAGLTAMRNRQRSKAAEYWQKALKIAPRDAPYLPVIEKAIQRLKGNDQGN